MIIIIIIIINTIVTIAGPMLTAWLDPPIVPHLQIYLFNITNPEEVT
jgi:hypothetical protein